MKTHFALCTRAKFILFTDVSDDMAQERSCDARRTRTMFYPFSQIMRFHSLGMMRCATGPFIPTR